MKYLLAIFCLSLSFGLHADFALVKSDTIRDSDREDEDIQEFNKMDYPLVLKSYKECREIYRYALTHPKIPSPPK